MNSYFKDENYQNKWLAKSNQLQLLLYFLAVIINLVSSNLAKADFPAPIVWEACHANGIVPPYPEEPPVTVLPYYVQLYGRSDAFFWLTKATQIPPSFTCSPGQVCCFGRYVCHRGWIGVEGYRTASDGTVYCKQENYTVMLFDGSGLTESSEILTSVEPDKSVELIAKVFDSQMVERPDVNIEISVDTVSFSGGHRHHDDDRPQGILIGSENSGTTITGITDDIGLQFTYNSPSPSGEHKLKVKCLNKECVLKGPSTLWVGIKDLVSIPPSASYGFVGDTVSHPDNHYLSSEMIIKVTSLAGVYNSIFPSDPILQFNDASLERGGLFDINQNWSPSHYEHRKGTVIDIRANKLENAIPERNFPVFNELASSLGSSCSLHSSGTNRHFHCRLAGVSE